MSKAIRAAGVLALFSVAAKLIGALYRIPLTNIIGVEGIGLYQLVFPIYSVLLTVASGGLPVAISGIVAKRIAKGEVEGARRVLSGSLISLSTVGTIMFLLLVVFRNRISVLQGNPLASLAYLGIAPSLLFVAIIACFRGYFNGLQNTVPSGLSQLTEQLIKLIVGLMLAKFLLRYGIEYAVLGAVLGVTVSEFIAAVALTIYFLIVNKKYLKRVRIKFNELEASAELQPYVGTQAIKKTRISDTLKELYKIALPVTLGQLVMPITQVVDSVLIVNILVNLGDSTATATSLFGLLNGPISTLINMPVVVTMSVAVAFLPVMAEAFSLNGHVGKIAGSAIKLTFFIAFLGFLVFLVFPRDLLSLLYRRSLKPELLNVGTVLLFLGSLTVVYVSLIQVFSSLLQGVGKAHIPAINLVTGAVIKVLGTLLFLPIFKITGAMIATILCYGSACILDCLAIRKHCPPKVKFREFLASPLLSGGGFILVGILSRKLFSLFLGAREAFIAALIIGALVYVAILLLSKGLSKEEIGSLLKKKKHSTNKEKPNKKESK